MKVRSCPLLLASTSRSEAIRERLTVGVGAPKTATFTLLAQNSELCDFASSLRVKSNPVVA